MITKAAINDVFNSYINRHKPTTEVKLHLWAVQATLTSMNSTTLTTIEASQRLGISRQMVGRLTKSGRLKADKYGPNYQIDLESVELYELERASRQRSLKAQPVSVSCSSEAA